MRAIFSWNNPPPANLPNWLPVWGERQDATILVEPRPFPPWPECLKWARSSCRRNCWRRSTCKRRLRPSRKALALPKSARLYREQDIPAHRFALKEIMGFVASPTTLDAGKFSELLEGVKLDPSIVDLIFPKDGDTSYEELTCIGLDPEHAGHAGAPSR